MKRAENLDCEVSASGFTLALQKDLEKHAAAARKDEEDNGGAAAAGQDGPDDDSEDNLDGDGDYPVIAGLGAMTPLTPAIHTSLCTQTHRPQSAYTRSCQGDVGTADDHGACENVTALSDADTGSSDELLSDDDAT